MTQNPGNPSGLRRTAAALLSAITVAAISYGATLLLFFAAGGATTTNLPGLSAYFVWGAVFVFVFSAILAAIGGYSRWYLALISGIIVGALGALVGSLLTIVAQGNALSGDVFSYAFGTLVGPNMVIWIAAIITTVSAGSWVWFRTVGRSAIAAAGATGRVALVRIPSSNLAEGEVTHIKRQQVDAEKADEQWDAYVAAFSANGWETVEVAAADGFADSVFVEDTVVLFGGTAIITSPGAESRRGEIAGVEVKARELGLRVERIEQPGTLDGGDVLKVGTTVYVGRGGRTNGEGIRQLRSLVAPLGYTVVAVPVSKALHLKSAVSALPDGTVLGFPALVNDSTVFERFLPVPEASGSAVVVLAPDTVLMAASAPKSIALVEDLGYRVVTVDISEFEKLEGCVTCLSVRVR